MFIEQTQPYNISFDEFNQIILDDPNYSLFDILKIITVASFLYLLDTVLFIATNYWYETVAVIAFYTFRYRLNRIKQGRKFPTLSMGYYVLLELMFITLVRNTNEILTTLFFILHSIYYENSSFISFCVLYTHYPIITLAFMFGSVCAGIYVDVLQ